MSTKIFVAGLPSDVRESELRDIFSKVGFGQGVVMGSMEASRTSQSKHRDVLRMRSSILKKLLWQKRP